MTGITKWNDTGDDMFCKSQLITCNRVKECNGVCPFEDALKHADKTQTMNGQHTVDHDKDWIIGCIEHDGFIHTHRFDKANQIILDALSAEPSGDLISRADTVKRLLSFKQSRAKSVSSYDMGFVDGLSHAINIIDLVPLVYIPSINIIDLAPSAEVVTHGRLIDADALEKELSKRWDISDDQDFCNKEVWDALRSAPTVPVVDITQRDLCADISCEDCPFMQETCKLMDYVAYADRPHGEWISKIDTGTWMLECSVCGSRVQEEKYRIAVGEDATKCPYCGAELGLGGYLYDEYAARPSQRGENHEAQDGE